MSYAKDGEDLWLLEQFPDGYKGYAVELGAVDGMFISCTKLLEERGWTCLCIEPNPIHQEALRGCRKLVMTCACGRFPDASIVMHDNTTIPGRTYTTMEDSALEYWRRGTGSIDAWRQFSATVLTLDQCLVCCNFPKLDVLVLDVDGVETDVLEGFDIDRWSPTAVIVEGGGTDDLQRARTEPFTSRGYTEVGVKMDDNRLLVRRPK